MSNCVNAGSCELPNFVISVVKWAPRGQRGVEVRGVGGVGTTSGGRTHDFRGVMPRELGGEPPGSRGLFPRAGR